MSSCIFSSALFLFSSLLFLAIGANVLRQPSSFHDSRTTVMESNSTSSLAVPQGWQVTWSDQYNQWYYVDEKTGISQWEHPSHLPYVPLSTTNPEHFYNDQAQPQYPQPNSTPPGTITQAEGPTDRGTISKLNSIDPKAQSALVLGSGLAAGVFLHHEYAEHHHHNGHHRLLGPMANLIGATGAGALGAKFFGRRGQATQPQPAPQPPATPYQPTSQPLYQASPPVWPGYSLSASPTSYTIPSTSPPLLTAPNNHLPSLIPLPFPTSIQPQQTPRPQLHIRAATFADADVTARVRSLVTPTQDLRIAKLEDEFGDPWPEAKRKAFCVLYQFGERPLEVWCGSTEDANVDIRNEALSNARMAFMNKDRGKIICLIWGQRSVLSKERAEKLERDGELDCKDLGDGGFWPWEIRNLICFYRTDDGGVGIGYGREGGTMRLPWNALAGWS